MLFESTRNFDYFIEKKPINSRIMATDKILDFSSGLIIMRSGLVSKPDNSQFRQFLHAFIPRSSQSKPIAKVFTNLSTASPCRD